MAAITETTHAGEFIVSEAPGTLSREKVTIVSGQDLAAGDVVGKITSGGKYAVYEETAIDGTEVAAGVLFDAVDASAADKTGVIIARLAEVNASELGWSDQDAGEIAAGTVDLLALNIVLR